MRQQYPKLREPLSAFQLIHKRNLRHVRRIVECLVVAAVSECLSGSNPSDGAGGILGPSSGADREGT